MIESYRRKRLNLSSSLIAAVAAVLLLALACFGQFALLGGEEAYGATIINGEEGAQISESGGVSSTSADVLSHVENIEKIMGETPLDGLIDPIEGLVETASGEEVIEVEDPDSAVLAEKMKALDRPLPMRNIDKSAVDLAKAYDEAQGAPMPYLQGNGRINFFFGTLNPRIVCRPLRLTDIELEPGERVTNVHISDAIRWIVSGASSGMEGALTTHVIVKPQLPDISANMLIHTDRRTYSIELISITEGQFMPLVGFVYPEMSGSTKASDAASWQKLLDTYRRSNESARSKKEEEKVRQRELGARGINPAEAYLKYTIKTVKGKNVAWKPIAAYDARGHTYIKMPDMMQVTEAPAFFIKANGKELLTNYRIEGNTYIIDRLFDIGILQVGGDRVAIYRTDPVSGEKR
ncbi:MAG: TrbG/VirB9 family P-type conjugative transfer protein [Synergistaceae bacterium]|jgi:type IV secretion system protein VirB9|nr:TrbG/VirB9 family P-type conjugative transfer protein [Synergistaceae bacterium]